MYGTTVNTQGQGKAVFSGDEFTCPELKKGYPGVAIRKGTLPRDPEGWLAHTLTKGI